MKSQGISFQTKSGHPDYGRRHHEEEFELGPVIQEMSFKGISYKSSVGLLLSRAEPFVQFWQEASQGTIL